MDRFTGFIGLAVILLACFALSRDRKRIRWATIGWGVVLQFALGWVLRHQRTVLAVTPPSWHKSFNSSGIGVLPAHQPSGCPI